MDHLLSLATMSLDTQGLGVLLLVSVCSTLLCYAGCVFYGTLS